MIKKTELWRNHKNFRSVNTEYDPLTYFFIVYVYTNMIEGSYTQLVSVLTYYWISIHFALIWIINGL